MLALTRRVGATDIQDVAAGTKAKRKLYSKEQRRFFAANTTGGITLDDLAVLSTKCAPGEAFLVAAEARAYLTGRGVDLSGNQQTKTRTALEYFSGAHGSPNE